ncbi:receptor-type tyrosine-protein phosphatase epsilon-like isoform X6 [Mercenaria mercenaria]|uniref:receptor-type tyrosine-protein phosphatase epsilon-like isoform X6 n=1 Tax=Mercenaria mercenaria TaxID=6596 RepID=UPI00234E7601|nr:receptor-type tyrosine-protein phosphatase epsilon-like isoform X6 [Mercenaria mercenaria]
MWFKETTRESIMKQCLLILLLLYFKSAVAQSQSDGGNKGVTIGASAGGGLFLVIIIVVIVVVLLLKKRNKKHTHEKKDATEVNDDTDNLVVTYSRIVTPSLHVEQNDADVVYAMPNKLKKNVDTVKSSNTDTPTKTVSNPNYEKPHAANDNTISNPNFENPTNNDTNVRKQTDSKPRIAAKPTSVYENAAARGSVAKNSTSMKAKQLDDSMLEIEEDIDNIARSSNDKSVAQPTTDSEVADTYYNVTAVKRRKIKLDQLPNCVSKKAKEDFIEEFQQLPPGLIKPYIDSQRKVNLSKNRYKGIYPYDETRVVLKEADSDYINASYIDGYNKRKAYIASIGPTYKYMGDMSAFWIMVWQEKVGKIVMLTKLDEGGAPKCDQYWPEKDFSLKYASIQVTCQSEESYADYTGRSFTLQKDSEKRKIVQVHFTAWPDKGTPDDVTSLIEFRQKVISTKTELEGPILVHCSAGIGRTGTYIALDSLTEEGEAEGEVDIYAFVRNMREQRVNMVQTAEQYQYLHNALVHTLTFDSKAVEASKFDKYMTSHTDDHLGEKFEKLQAFVEQSSDDEVDAVKRNQALRNKNRVGADIPGDRNRPKLYLERKLGSSDYINAVYVNSYTTINRYMVAQTPLPDTVVDFLTLIIQEKVACIVSMETDSVDDKTIGLYYPADNQTLKKGTFTVKSVRENDTEQYVIRKLEIVHKGKFGTEDVRIPHIQLTQWNENKNIPEEPAKFVQFVKDVEVKYGGNQSKGPILVHCLTGAEKSGLFCVVSNLLEKTQIDQETSVVNAVRQIKYRRHMSIPNKDQYTFCHQCVNEYLRTFDIYSNFELKT